MIGEEPEQVLQGGCGQRPQHQGQHQGNEDRPQRVEEALPDQHDLQLPPGHADGLEHGKLPLPGQDARQNGVEEVQHAHQPHNEAQRPAQHQEHGAEALKLRLVGDLAHIVVLGILVFRVVGQEVLHGRRPALLGVEGIEHHAVTLRILAECCIVEHKFIRPIVAITQTAGHSYQRRHLIGNLLVFHRPGQVCLFLRGFGPEDLPGGGAVIFKF